MIFEAINFQGKLTTIFLFRVSNHFHLQKTTKKLAVITLKKGSKLMSNIEEPKLLKKAHIPQRKDTVKRKYFCILLKSQGSMC